MQIILPAPFNDYYLETDIAKFDFNYIQSQLQTTYWAKTRSHASTLQAFTNSLAFQLLLNQQVIGFARVVTDQVLFAYLADVFIDPAYRGRGLAKTMVGCIIDLPQLTNIQRWLLRTQDAHALYYQLGFTELTDTAAFLQLVNRH